MFNLGKWIGDFLRSLNNQRTRGFEVVFVDDGSTDSTVDEVRRFPFPDDISVKLIQQENSGAGPARWAGLAAATRTYVAFLDGDDWISPSYIHEVDRTIRRRRPDAICVGYAKYHEPHKEYSFPKKYRIPSGWVDLETVLCSTFPAAWTKVYRREAINHLAPFPAEVHHQDWFSLLYLSGRIKRAYPWALDRVAPDSPDSFFFSVFSHSLPYEPHAWCYDADGLVYQIQATGLFSDIRVLNLEDDLANIPFTHNRPQEDVCVIGRRRIVD